MSMFAIAGSCAARRNGTKSTANAALAAGDAAALGILAMSIVHDLRNPLTAIYSGAEMLHSSPLDEDQVRRLARNMYNAAARIRELLQDYSDHCRASEALPCLANLRNLIAQAAERMEAVAETQSVTVVIDVPVDLVVTVNRRRIGSVLSNLLANALEAMPDGGRITISASKREDWVVVKVIDAGPGVAPEIRDRLFEPFVTARKSNGWGLGLASARHAIADHGGQMWLESPASRGACFAFSLPAP